MNKYLKIIPSAFGLSLGLCWIIASGGASHKTPDTHRTLARTTQNRPSLPNTASLAVRDTVLVPKPLPNP
ncbi:hypothetical protein [Larkinella harenae]